MTLHEGLVKAAEIAVGGAFFLIGVRNTKNRAPIAQACKAAGLPMAEAVALVGIAMQIGFGALLASGVDTAISALGLLVFVVAATLIAHSFWTLQGEARETNFNAFLANCVMAGGLLALAATDL